MFCYSKDFRIIFGTHCGIDCCELFSNSPTNSVMGLMLYGIFDDVLSDLKVISGSNYIFDVVEIYF